MHATTRPTMPETLIQPATRPGILLVLGASVRIVTRPHVT
jgi:hypothetical protein